MSALLSNFVPMTSLSVLVQFLFVFKLAPTSSVWAVKHRLRHIVDKCIDHVSQSLDLNQIIITCNVL